MNNIHQSNSLKPLINERLQRIANALLLNASFIPNLGLLNGKMGIVIFFFHYARYTGKEVYSNYAGELIDEIYEEIHADSPIDFADGIAGIGWGLEYLIKNGFVEAELNETLAEIDAKIISVCKAGFQKENNILTGLAGTGFYLLTRIKSFEDKKSSIFIKLRRLLLRLNKELIKRIQIPSNTKENYFESLLFGEYTDSLFFLIESYKNGIGKASFKKILPLLIEQIEEKERDNNFNPLVLSLLYSNISFIHNDPYFIEKAQNILEMNKPENMRQVQIKKNDCTINNGMAGFYWLTRRLQLKKVLPNIQSEYWIEQLLNINEVNSSMAGFLPNKSNDFKGDILNGLAGIGITLLLHLENKEFIYD